MIKRIIERELFVHFELIESAGTTVEITDRCRILNDYSIRITIESKHIWFGIEGWIKHLDHCFLIIRYSDSIVGDADIQPYPLVKVQDRNTLVIISEEELVQLSDLANAIDCYQLDPIELEGTLGDFRKVAL